MTEIQKRAAGARRSSMFSESLSDRGPRLACGAALAILLVGGAAGCATLPLQASYRTWGSFDPTRETSVRREYNSKDEIIAAVRRITHAAGANLAVISFVGEDGSERQRALGAVGFMLHVEEAPPQPRPQPPGGKEQVSI